MSFLSRAKQANPSKGVRPITSILAVALLLLLFFVRPMPLNFERHAPVGHPGQAGGDVYLNQRVRTTLLLDMLPPMEKDRLANADAIIFISSKPPMTMLEARAWLKEQHDRLEAQGEGNAAAVTVHFRPDGELEYNELMKLMTAVKVAGFHKIKMHATDVAAESPSDLTVKVRTQFDAAGANDGAISALTITNAQAKEQSVEGGLDGLKAQLKQMRAGLTEKNNVKVQADAKLKVKHLMAVMDACKAAGFEHVSMVPPEDFAR
jgi:biopolymer transport protein ExbD